MMKYVVLFSLCVSFLNISLNNFAEKAASSVDQWHLIFTTKLFAVALIVGLCSLMCVASVYFFAKGETFGLANGILIMGAASVVGGVGYGMWLGNELRWSEYVIAVLIVLFSIVRFFATVSKDVA
jgi:hypothetical protein